MSDKITGYITTTNNIVGKISETNYEKAYLKLVTVENMKQYEIIEDVGTIGGMSYYGLSLILNAKSTLRIYFRLTPISSSDVINDYKAYIDGVEKSLVKSGSNYYIELEFHPNTAAQTRHITVTNSKMPGKEISLYASPFSYVYNVAKSTTTTEANRKKVFYFALYCMAA